MPKKEEQRLCPHCDGYIPYDVLHCPYCAADVEMTALSDKAVEEGVLPPPYASKFSVTKEEWAETVEGEKKEREGNKNEMVAILMLIPGVALALFALLILFFSKEGVLTLQWKESFAYLYLLGAIPLLILGFRALR